MKKFSFLSALVLPLFIASAASAGPVYSTGTATSLGTPAGITIAQNGNIYVAENYSEFFSSTGLVQIFTPNGIPLSTISDTGSNSFIAGMTTTVSGTSYVVNYSLGTVQSFSPSGFGPQLAAGSGPWGIVASGNDLIVADFNSGSVGRITSTGFQTLFSVPFNPGFVAVSPSGNILVSAYGGYGGTQLNTYSPSGTLLNAATIAETAGPIVYDSLGTIWMLSLGTGKILQLNSAGTVLQTINDPVSSTLMGGIAIDAYGTIWVTDRQNGLLQKITGAGAGAGLGTRQIASNPDAPTGLAAATVSHTTMKLSWNYQTSPTTQFICTASNGATATVTGTSCSLNGFDLYNPGSYSFSVTAVVDGVQSDAAVLSVSVKS